MSTLAHPVARWQWTAARYFRALESGLIDPDERLELIDGELLHMPPINPAHAQTVGALNIHLARHLDLARFELRTQQPLAFSTSSWPEPDIAVVRAAPQRETHPSAADTLWIIEVADTSLNRDQTSKLALYAAHEIPEYWVVDVGTPNRAVWVYTEVRTQGYRHSTRHDHGVLQPHSVPGISVPFDLVNRG